MINVIILTENKKYQVLDVPTNGKLHINEPHLISAITLNGVLMVPYGNVLTPFEVYVFDNCISTTMVTANLLHPAGRLLDFTVIELLQFQNTINPANSGSEKPYEKPEFYNSSGEQVAYNLRIQGDEIFTDQNDADSYFKTHHHYQSYVDGIAFDGVSQFISLKTTSASFPFRGNRALKVIEDLTGEFRTMINQHYKSNTHIEEIIAPGLVSTGWQCFTSNTNFRRLYAPQLHTLGDTYNASSLVGVNTVGNTPFDLTCQLSLSTVNAGAPHGDIVELQNSINGLNVTYI